MLLYCWILVHRPHENTDPRFLSVEKEWENGEEWGQKWTIEEELKVDWLRTTSCQ